MVDARVSGRAERTRARLLACALELFERQGYEQTPVAQIASAAGVTEMTFFRHFPTKSQVLFEDPYDPLIAAAIAGQPRSLSPLLRTVRAIRQAWSWLPKPDGIIVRRRVRIIATTPSLRGEVWRNSAATEQIIVDQLVQDGTALLSARVAAAAVLSALTVALLEWSRHEDIDLIAAIAIALETLEPSDG